MKKTLDARDTIPLPLDIYAIDPEARNVLVVLISSRAVTAAKDSIDPDWPYCRYPRQDWTANK